MKKRCSGGLAVEQLSSLISDSETVQASFLTVPPSPSSLTTCVAPFELQHCRKPAPSSWRPTTPLRQLVQLIQLVDVFLSWCACVFRWLKIGSGKVKLIHRQLLRRIMKNPRLVRMALPISPLRQSHLCVLSQTSLWCALLMAMRLLVPTSNLALAGSFLLLGCSEIYVHGIRFRQSLKSRLLACQATQ